jgi:hypothetical protein
MEVKLLDEIEMDSNKNGILILYSKVDLVVEYRFELYCIFSTIFLIFAFEAHKRASNPTLSPKC